MIPSKNNETKEMALTAKVNAENYEGQLRPANQGRVENGRMQCDWCNRFFTSQRGVERHKTYCAWHPQRLKGNFII